MASSAPARVLLFFRAIPTPARIVAGVALVALGLFGFLPVLGFWMVPLGLLILSLDIPALRRAHSRLRKRLRAWLARRRGAQPASRS